MDFQSYLSPYSWRYGSAEMRSLWSEVNKRRLWRHIWVALAEAQSVYGLVSPGQLTELQEHVEDVNVSRSLEIEGEIHHDLMAELKAYAEQCPHSGGILHLGATSMDIEDNADALRLRQSLDLILARLAELLSLLTEQIDRWSDTVIIGMTHLQPAEPLTLGYRLAQYAQDLLLDWEEIRRRRRLLRGKGFKGAVGTGASYAELIGAENIAEFETRLSTRLGLPFFEATTQTYPRKQDYLILNALAGLGGSLNKFAFDLRLLQSPSIGELSEPFGRRQVGSSAMPFKRNPINAEKIDSLARLLAQMPRVAWDNAAHSLLERTLDDSANRRSILPEAFLIADELLSVSKRIVEGLKVDLDAIQRNLALYAPFAAMERVLMASVKAGADRQEMHELLRWHSLKAWEAVQQGLENSLMEQLSSDEKIALYLNREEIRVLMDVKVHIGDAPTRAKRISQTIRDSLV